MDQILTSENKKTTTKKESRSRIFDFSRGLRVFSTEFFLVYGSIFSHIPHKKSEELPLACLFEVFTELWLSTTTFCIKSYDYAKHFVRVLVLLVINTRCLKKFLKNGEHYVVDFQFNLC